MNIEIGKKYYIQSKHSNVVIGKCEAVINGGGIFNLGFGARHSVALQDVLSEVPKKKNWLSTIFTDPIPDEAFTKRHERP